MDLNDVPAVLPGRTYAHEVLSLDAVAWVPPRYTVKLSVQVAALDADTGAAVLDRVGGTDGHLGHAGQSVLIWSEPAAPSFAPAARRPICVQRLR